MANDGEKDFYPRAPHGARRVRVIAVHAVVVISIHALRMERDYNPFDPAVVDTISIHALRMERDLRAVRRHPPGIISIHALRMERDYF